MASEIKNKKWLGYTAYVVLVAGVLLYTLFPGQEIDRFLDNSLQRINPEYGFRAEKIRPWVPAGIRITAGEVYLNSPDERVVFASDTLVVRPEILGLVKGERRFDLSGKAYSGDMDCTLHFTDDEKGLFASEMSFRNFALAEYDFLAEKFTHKVTGKLSGEIAYSMESEKAFGGNGRANLRLEDGQLQLSEPVFNIVSVDLKSIRLEAELSRRAITIIKAELTGREVNGSMTGSIQLQEDLDLSQLNLKGTLEPLAEFYQNHPEIRELLKTMKKRVRRGQFFFTVTGTLGEPKFNLL